MTPAALEIALCVLDTVAKYAPLSPPEKPLLPPYFPPLLDATRPKLCISRRPGATLPRVRFVNSAFESCFGHQASWICGRSVTVLCGLLTSSLMMLRLCAEVDWTLALPLQCASSPLQQEGKTGGLDVVLYTAGGVPMQVRASVFVLPNLSADSSKESVAVLVLDT
mmetsp:Transcript_8417/g.14272  ORF Transcript_8417/g.14272 Transcript_8417/m.14272 type:complete len:166 (+) Transcript_8417:176-673(+)|eukprot:CAMPEP_0114463420 /NCGR_PEP_ID=MMETSP0104-20121206/7356_1 /TAXON_ID=37642 ORGANISM="Paraphysomonas imperforata, Strain PA2" /NCGR_SAMPLE_ID=MMETSP0104 /ASSEMBLY_ACC=CAM_ASM_000202 /LENGTH=165 /DNA_ID=CAMNT_0001636371 /DNA_START=657 /DNA_END=1154 /DNA_ORIENTATION=-